ncbi:EpsG family protein [Chitinophaga sp. YR573]|uniref:EpsG family protein n=1 Tax=Chitinophaga sp. YR573 TaxID=1881040 RepID=UPI0008BB467A|nr:EpsG family protein [Chitinophaga sp. YR573]SEW14473.1 EpsG family protein [Chitinophaga sp. YR573]
MIYYCILLILFFFSFLELSKIQKVHKLYILFTVLVMFVVIGGLRFEVGVDWFSYKDIFRDITNKTASTYPLEPLYILFNLIIKDIGGSYQLVVFSVALIAITLKLTTYFKYSPYVMASLMVYLSVQFMAYELNGVRQGLAVGIAYTSIGFLLQRRLVPYLIIVGIACMVHYSAIIFLPFYFIANKEIRLSVINIGIFGSLLIGIFLQSLLKNLITNHLTGDMYLAAKVLSYSEDDTYGESASLGFSAVHRLVIFYIFLLNRGKFSISDKFYRLLLNAYFISLLIYFLLSPIQILAGRLGLYYRVADVFIIALFLDLGKDLKTKFIILVLIALYCYWGVRTNLVLPDNGLIPYKNFYLK